MRVDLPAPFSPRRATTSPGDTVRLTSLRACVPPKRFDAWLTSSKDVSPGSLGNH